MQELLYLFLGLCIFIALALVFDLKWTSPTHKRRLLTIKHLGDSSFLKYRTGNHRLMLLKYNLERVKPINKHRNNLERLILRNHLSFDVDSYIAYKVLSCVMLTAAFLFVSSTRLNDGLYAFVLNNANLILTYSIILMAILFIDTMILEFRFSMLKKQVKEELPFFSTLFQMSIEAGDNLYNALKESMDESHGLLKSEFEIVLSEVGAGIPFPKALSDMDDRLGIDELGHFISFLRRVSAADYDDFSVFIEKQRISMLVYEVNLAKEYEKTIPQRLTAYNSFTFIADFTLSLAPVAFMILGDMNF